MHPSAVSALIALLHTSLERIVVLNEPYPHGDGKVTRSDLVGLTLLSRLSGPAAFPCTNDTPAIWHDDDSSTRRAAWPVSPCLLHCCHCIVMVVWTRCVSLFVAVDLPAAGQPGSPSRLPHIGSQKEATATLILALLRAQIFDSGIYSLLREAPRLTSLELRGFEFPGMPFGALAGAAIRHLTLHVDRFHDDQRRSNETTLTSVLGDLPQLTSLDMTFPKCAPFHRCRYLPLKLHSSCACDDGNHLHALRACRHCDRCRVPASAFNDAPR